MWAWTRVPAANEDMRDNSPAKTAAQMTRANREALAPGSSTFDPVGNIMTPKEKTEHQKPV